MTGLTPLETADLERLENIVQKHEQGFVLCGLAIAEIRDRKLYRKDYDTFETYCLARWGWSRQRAQQLERAAKLVESLPEKSAALVPDERSARTLAEIPANQRAPILQKLARAGEPINPCSISKKADSIAPNVSTQVDKPKNGTPDKLAEKKAAKEIVRDAIGIELPEKCVEFWNRKPEVQELLTAVSRVRSTIKAAAESEDELWRDVNCQKIIIDLSNAYDSLHSAIPYAVCPTCSGRLAKCTLCNGRGYLSQFAWNMYVPREVKEIRIKAGAR